MLALTRKKDEAIVIGGNIEIRVLEVKDGKVKLGINAPKETSIYREEIYIEIQKDNQEAIKGMSQEVLSKSLESFLKKWQKNSKKFLKKAKVILNWYDIYSVKTKVKWLNNF